MSQFFRRTLTLFTALALGVSAVLFGPVLTAQGVGEAWTWYPQDGSGVTTVGSTDILTITGTASGCGTNMIPSADIYVVENRDWGPVPLGASLAGLDVTNSQKIPNTYVGWSIIQEPLWFPTLRTGGYDIVIDCDVDGAISEFDQVIGFGADPGVTIAFTGRVNELFKEQLKEEYGARWGWAPDDAALIDRAVFFLQVSPWNPPKDKGKLVRWVGMKFIKGAVGAISDLIGIDDASRGWKVAEASGMAVLSPGTVVADGVERLQDAATAIYADPPDPNYTDVASYVAPTNLADESVSDPVLAGFARLANAYSYAAAWSEALLHAVERFDGAALDDARAAMKLQAQAVADNSTGLGGAITQIREESSTLQQAINDSGVEDTCTVDLETAKAAQVRVANGGFSAVERQGFLDAGLTDSDIAALRDQIVEMEFPETCWTDYLTTLLEDEDTYGNSGGERGLWTEEALLELNYQALNIVDALDSGVGQNQSPIAESDSFTVANDQYITFYPTSNDRDPEGDSLTFSVVTQPTHGTVTCDEWATCEYTPTAGYVGADSFTYRISDSEGLSDEATVSFDVVASGRMTLRDNNVEVAPGGTITFDVISDDYLPYGGYISSWTQPSSGEVTCENGGYQCTYTADPTAVQDSFTYTVTGYDPDTGGDTTATATVYIVVNNKNKPPVVFFDVPSVEVDEGSAPDISFSASDPDGQIVSYKWTTNDPELTSDSTYPPAPPDNGDYTYTLTVTDNLGATASATIEVTVNNVPPNISADIPNRATPSATVNYTSSASDQGSIDNDALKIEWNFGDGPVEADASGGVSHLWSATGTYTVSVIVIDKDGARSDPVTQQVAVADVVVNAGPDFTVKEGEEASLDFSNSTQPDLYLTYDVDYGDGTSEAIGGLTPIHWYPHAGVYTVTLTGTDSIDSVGPVRTTKDTVIVTVENVPPVVAFASQSYVSAGTSIEFQAYVVDPGGTEGTTFTWDFGDGSVATDPWQTTHTFAVSGNYDVRVTAVDPFGGTGDFTQTIAVLQTPPAANFTSNGREFWLAFDSNVESQESEYLKLYVAGSPGTTGRAVIAGLAFVDEFTIPADGVAVVDIPLEARLSLPSDPVALAIQVTSSADVSVYGLNRVQYTTDAFLGLPVSAIGDRYRVMSYYNAPTFFDPYPSLLSVVAAMGETTIHVVPPSSTGYDPFDKSLKVGEVFEWSATADITGTLVTSDKPISVFSGNLCVDIPQDVWFCDHIVEQMIPTNTWGKTFITFPLATRLKGDTFRILADVDNTTVTIVKAGGDVVETLDAGEYYEFISEEPMAITANQPILVAQYSNGAEFDGVTSDPFMALIPPYEQGFTDSTFATPTEGFENYVNITVPTASVAGVTLDGTVIPAASWVEIPGSGYSGAAIAIEPGTHSISSLVPLQTLVYGFGPDDSYGYPGGLRTARIADARTLSLNPPSVTGAAGDELCTVATLADQDGVGIVGARIDVSLSGAVSQISTLVTDSAGTVTICATSSDEGIAAITATQADLKATGSFTWQPAGPSEQKVLVVYYDDDDKVEVTPKAGTVGTLSGVAGSPVGFTEAIAKAGVPDGYDFVSVDNVDVFDDDLAVDQTITVHLSHHHTLGAVESTRTITYTGPGALAPADVVQRVEWTTDTDEVTGVTTYAPSGSYEKVATPVVEGYTFDRAEVLAEVLVGTTTAPVNATQIVTYVKDQVVQVIYRDDEGKVVVSPEKGTVEAYSGPAGSSVGFTEKLAKAGVPDKYDFVSLDNTAVFDNDPDVDQTITVHLVHHHSVGKVETTRTITYKGLDSKPADVVQRVEWATDTDEVTGVVTYTPSGSYAKVATKSVEGYAFDRAEVPVVSLVKTTVKPVNVTETVTYVKVVASSQVVRVVYRDDDGKVVVSPKAGAVTIRTGVAGASVGYTEALAKAGVPAGYDFVSVDNVAVFDKDSKVDQTITVHLKHHHSVGKVESTRTIIYKGLDSKPDDVVQRVEWATDKDEVMGVTTFTPSGSYVKVETKSVEGYTFDRAEVPAVSLVKGTTAPANTTETVVYTKVVVSSQTVVVVYRDDDDEVVVSAKAGIVESYSGPAGSPVGFTEVIAKAGVPDGYDYVSIDNVDVFDDDSRVDQTITVHLVHHHRLGTVETTRTITYKGLGALTPADVVQRVEWTTDTDEVTGVTTYKPTGSYVEVPTPSVKGYTFDRSAVPLVSHVETATAPDHTTETVVYAASAPPTVPPKPTAPTKPTVPTTPTLPAKPTLPATPTLPTKPTAPGTPIVPVATNSPGEANTPGTSSVVVTPSGPAIQTGGTVIPSGGDPAGAASASAVAMLLLAGFALMMRKKRS